MCSSTCESTNSSTASSSNGSRCVRQLSRSATTSTPGKAVASTFTQPGMQARPHPRFSFNPIVTPLPHPADILAEAEERVGARSCYARVPRLQPFQPMSSALFSPFKLRKLTLANRIVVSPMCQYSAVDGCASDWHLAHWVQMLESSAGMFTIEATAVSAIGRITPGCLGLYDGACEKALGKRLVIARRNAPPMPVAIQLAHAGRKGSSHVPWEGGQLIPHGRGGWTPVAPSAIPQLAHEKPPA